MVRGRVYIGVGGWTFEPWRGPFYPDDLPHKRELEFASRHLTSIEVNGTYYSTFKPATFAKWRDETPDGFVFALKASRYCTNRRELALAGPAVERFVTQGIHELGDKLGPINWQFMETKHYERDDMESFLKLLPKEIHKRPLRHAVEVRHPSFVDETFYEMARRHKVAIVFADSAKFPAIAETTADFTYARLMRTMEDVAAGYSGEELDHWAKAAKKWGEQGDAFVYVIAGAKIRNPAAAQALIARVQDL